MVHQGFYERVGERNVVETEDGDVVCDAPGGIEGEAI
jgi:hypothetical protein